MFWMKINIRILGDYKLKIVFEDKTGETCFYKKIGKHLQVLFYKDYYIVVKHKNKYYMIEKNIFDEKGGGYESEVQSI